MIIFGIPSIQGIHTCYNNSFSRVNLTPYSEVICLGVILTPKRSLRNSFSGVKIAPDLELKITQKKELS